MKSFAVLLALLLCSIASAQGENRLGQDPVSQDPIDYNINVHISATHFRTKCKSFGTYASCHDGLYLDATLDGQKLELFGAVDNQQSSPIVPGDYRAMLPRKPRAGGRAILGQSYFMLLPDKTAWPCSITGFSE
jgi:hypothetical protein